MSSTDPFLNDIESFLKRHGMLPTTFGKLAANDPTFVFDLRGGRDIRRKTENKIRQFMSDYGDQQSSIAS